MVMQRVKGRTRTFKVTQDELGQLVEQQALEVDTAQSALEGSRAMGDDAHNLGDKLLVGRDASVPALHELAQYDGQQRVQLQIDVVPARERREQGVYRWRRR